MSENPIIDSGTQSFSTSSGLNPELTSALASLEVQLDQELARYRRTRHGIRQTKPFRVENYIPDQSHTSNDINEVGVKTQLSVPEFNNPVITGESPSVEREQQQEVNHLPLSSVERDNNSETSLSLPDSEPISSIVPAKTLNSESETLISVNNTLQQTDDYLESSEALIRSVQEDSTSANKSGNSRNSGLSPLGVASMLLMLLASLTLGYVIFNPQTWPRNLPQLDLDKLLNRNSLPDQNNATTPASVSSPIPQPESTAIPKYPNLATREFPEVRGPNDIAGLKPKVKPTPTLIPTPIAIATPKPVVTRTPVPTVSAIPTPKKTLSAQNVEIKPSVDGFYYVITDNQGDKALNTAKSVVADAYLSAGKKYIYLGALKNEEDAKRKIKELEAKGIKARIRQP